ncbi:hypothetical protein B0H21DRAFT_244136 [Amylocystis lapponica]|nr:hypothetical protein B0H21DRAFT_244136 [Amylocystis lapponica]
MLEPLAATVFNTLLSGRSFTAHFSPSQSALRMVKCMTASSFPQDFFTPRPRRVKGKERARSVDDSVPRRTMIGLGDAGPSTPAPSCRYPSSLRDVTSSRQRTRRISSHKLVHGSSRRDVPSLRSWVREASIAQRRHASSLPEPLGTSSSSPSAWQQDQWRTCIMDFSSDGTSSDPEHAWNAYENLQDPVDANLWKPRTSWILRLESPQLRIIRHTTRRVLGNTATYCAVCAVISNTGHSTGCGSTTMAVSGAPCVGVDR